ncbi:MAG: alpha/beta hydrolase-fold protein [Bifidobacterium aquikefiri]|uniref:alpha/beta hydrolase n=1 Tax=Bifidobacterium aquikefiri TaxID=1653207 RepID=UPI0039EC28C9
MLHDIAKIRLLSGWFPNTVLWITVAGFAILCISQILYCGRRHGRFTGLQRLLMEIVASAASAGIGWTATWLISDVYVLFGVSLGWDVIRNVAVGFAILAFAIASCVLSRNWRRTLACILIPIALLNTAIRVNAAYGEYTIVGSVLGLPTYSELQLSRVHKATMSVAQWEALAAAGKAPQHRDTGSDSSFAIPATVSHFRSREADIYLPPAALAATPPRLPVMIMLGGQPGSPDRMFTASGISHVMNEYAQSHDGLAPIVVSPDQNGSAVHNTLCIDSPVYGNAATFLTKDVTSWIKKHLPVETTAKYWTIGGFSQGGTCTTQLGPRNPKLYGHMFPVDGEMQPTNGSESSMIRRFYGGSRAAYEAQIPVNAITQHAPSTQTMFTVAGEQDPESVNNMKVIGAAAQKAGMKVQAVITKGSGHDWHTVKSALVPGIYWICAQMGLGTDTKPISEYPNLVDVKL